LGICYLITTLRRGACHHPRPSEGIPPRRDRQPTKWKNEDGRLNTHAPRFAGEYGKDALSYELDALPAPVLRQLVREAIQEHVSKEEHEEALAEQEEDRLELRNRVERMRNGDDDPEYAWE
jgi:hypothetical protein